MKHNAAQSTQISKETSLTQRNASARGVKFSLDHQQNPQPSILAGSNSNNSLHQSHGFQQDPSKFHKNVNIMPAYEKPIQGFSASNGYLTQIHSPSKRLNNGKSTPEMMKPIAVGMK